MVAHKQYRQDALGIALVHFCNTAMSKAFYTWKEYALHKAQSYRKAKAYLSLMLGKHLGWAFAMLRWG